MSHFQEYDNQVIMQLYRQLSTLSGQQPLNRLQQLSAYFLGKPYLLGALGEGDNGRFDQNPLYRIDSFDCLTYVNTILALLFSNNLNDFQKKMVALNYRYSKIAYENRHHFVSIDWNPENYRLGFLCDITQQIKGENNESIAVVAETLIDRTSWFFYHQLNNIKIWPPLNSKEQKQRLQELRALGNQFIPEISRLLYLPMTQLFDENGKPKFSIFAQIPSGSIVEIIRPNWDLHEKIGTCLDVSHLGFAIWQENVLIFREASSRLRKVADTPLIFYLQDYINHPSIKGINIQLIRLCTP